MSDIFLMMYSIIASNPFNTIFPDIQVSGTIAEYINSGKLDNLSMVYEILRFTIAGMAAFFGVIIVISFIRMAELFFSEIEKNNNLLKSFAAPENCIMLIKIMYAFVLAEIILLRMKNTTMIQLNENGLLGMFNILISIIVLSSILNIFIDFLHYSKKQKNGSTTSC